mgnify:CR=1 FL=1
MKNLLVLDIDGTVTESDRSIRVETMEALRKIKKERPDVITVLVSGNVLPVMYGIRGIIGVGEALFAENGGILLHNGIIQKFFEPEITRKAFEKIHREMGAIEFITNRWRETSVSFILDGNNDFSSYEREFDVRIEDSGFAKHIMNRGQNKGFAVRKIMEIYGVDKENVYACGDGENDITMFKEAGFTGCPANSNPRLKEISGFVSEKYYGDGLLDILHHFSFI